MELTNNQQRMILINNGEYKFILSLKIVPTSFFLFLNFYASSVLLCNVVIYHFCRLILFALLIRYDIDEQRTYLRICDNGYQFVAFEYFLKF